MLLNYCYCPYIRTILKYVHHFANIAKKYYTEIAGIFGMTAIIIMRIENSNEFLKIVLASLYAVICVFYAIQASRNAKVSTFETDKCLKQLHYALIISYISILIVLMI